MHPNVSLFRSFPPDGAEFVQHVVDVSVLYEPDE